MTWNRRVVRDSGDTPAGERFDDGGFGREGCGSWRGPRLTFVDRPQPGLTEKAKGSRISGRSSWSVASDGIAGGSRASAWKAR
jgi:hypothetical protein